MPTLLTVPSDTHLSLSRTAVALDVSRQRVLSLSAAGEITATVMGGRMFFQRAQVEALRDKLATGERKARRGRR